MNVQFAPIASLPLVLIACTTTEQCFAHDADKRFPAGDNGFAEMCASIGEIMSEH